MQKVKNNTRKFPISPEDKVITFRRFVDDNEQDILKSAKSNNFIIQENKSIGQKRIIKDSEEIFGPFV